MFRNLGFGNDHRRNLWILTMRPNFYKGFTIQYDTGIQCWYVFMRNSHSILKVVKFYVEAEKWIDRYCEQRGIK